jgi:hypothetical protein
VLGTTGTLAFSCLFYYLSTRVRVIRIATSGGAMEVPLQSGREAVMLAFLQEVELVRHHRLNELRALR